MPTTEQLQSILRDVFGLSEFRTKQQEVIENVLEGHHTLALLPTGYGKSLCYQVPSQALPGITLVVSPLIALMQDQVNNLIKRGLTNVTLLNSSLDMDEREERLAGIESGAYKLVYVAPERFESGRFRRILSEIDVSLLVIDEAHCISQWGHDFRPHYRKLSNYLSHIGAATILALTATATPVVQADIVQSLKLDHMRVVVGNFDRPNLRFVVRDCRNNYEKDDCVIGAITADDQPSIIYTSSRKETEALAARLRQSGIRAAFYHAGMTRDQRMKAQRAFELDQVRVIVCTVAFGMGIDKANVRRVIHYNMPGSVESYYQEAGRAGRDGGSSDCLLLYQAKDIFTQRFLLSKNFPDRGDVEQLRRKIVTALDPVHVDDLKRNSRIDDSALNNGLDLLRHLKLIIVDESGSSYQATDLGRSNTPVDMRPLEQRRQREEARLQTMINYATSRFCRRRQILQYFGQRLQADCTGCDQCMPELATVSNTAPVRAALANSGSSKSSANVARHPAPAEVEIAILGLIGKLEGRVGRTSVAQILAGSRSRKIVDKGLNKLDQYGLYARHGEKGLLTMIDELVGKDEISVSSGMYPKVHLTHAGRSRLSGAGAG